MLFLLDAILPLDAFKVNNCKCLKNGCVKVTKSPKSSFLMGFAGGNLTVSGFLCFPSSLNS